MDYKAENLTKVEKRILKVNEPFKFFQTIISAGDQTQMEVAELQEVGFVTRLATSIVAEKVHALNMLDVIFEIDAPPRQKTKPSRYSSVMGEPTENLFLIATLTGGQTYLSKGVVEDEVDATKVKFDSWVNITDANFPSEIKQILRERQANPLSIPASDLTTVLFQFRRY